MNKKKWVEWHEKYDEPSSDLNARLKIVRNVIKGVLPKTIEEKYRILDICAGDGRDLLPVLKDYGEKEKVEAKLIEIDQTLSDKARGTIESMGLQNIQVTTGDASNTKTYADIVPADLILLCGVFGNISNADVEKIIAALPEFCKQGGRIIWTRNRREPDMTPWIRQLFSANGFAELYFIAPAQNTYAIGINAREQAAAPYTGDRSLFTFIR